MSQEGYSFRYCNGFPRQKAPNGVMQLSRLEILPQEIHREIFSTYLTFRETAKCLAVSKTLRSAILYKEGWGHVVSNESSRYQLSRVLPLYKSVLRGKRINVLEVTADHPLSQEERSEAADEMRRLTVALAEQLCFSIEKAVIKMYCISDKNWFDLFADITCSSLTDLTIYTSIAPAEIPRTVQYILNRFCKLRNLTFGTHYHILKRNGAGSKKGVTTVDPENYIHATPAWDKKNLALTSLKVESHVNMQLLGAVVFRSMPNLRRFSCRGDLVASGSEEGVFHTLIRQYPSLEFVSIKQECCPCFQYEVATNIFTQITTSGSIREFRIIGRGTGCTRTEWYIKALLVVTNDTLGCVQIASPDCEYLFFMAAWEFPLLQYFVARCNGRVSRKPRCIGHQDLCGVHLLSRFKNLREIELKYMQVNISALKALEALKHLELLVLNNCFGVPPGEELQRLRFEAYVI